MRRSLPTRSRRRPRPALAQACALARALAVALSLAWVPTLDPSQVIAAANEYQMAMAFSGLRLFHH